MVAQQGVDNQCLACARLMVAQRRRWDCRSCKPVDVALFLMAVLVCFVVSLAINFWFEAAAQHPIQ